jgi:hypothetical protein
MITEEEFERLIDDYQLNMFYQDKEYKRLVEEIEDIVIGLDKNLMIDYIKTNFHRQLTVQKLLGN